MNQQQQLYRSPDLLKDPEADIARWLATNPNESETIREAAEECLRCLERAG